MRSFREEVFEILQTWIRIVAPSFKSCVILVTSLTSLFSLLKNGGGIILAFSFAWRWNEEMRIKHFMQWLKRNKYQQMSITMVKCFGMKSRIIGGRITGSSTKAPKEEKTPQPPKPLFYFHGWPSPRPPSGSCMPGKWMSREGGIQVFVASKSLNYFSPIISIFPFSLLHHEFLYLLPREH